MQDLSISVHYDSHAIDAVQWELDLDGEPIFFGVWDVGVRWRGRPLRPLGPWTEICDYDENGCDYLELDLPLTRDYRLQRFFLLDHDDKVLVLGDTLLWDGDAEPKKSSDLCYESSLLHSTKLKPRSKSGSTELTFHRGPAPVFRVLPLALPERKTDETENDDRLHGDLLAENDALQYRLHGRGASLFAPLIFDFDTARLKKPFTWRHLTVGEDLQKVPVDRAAGFRIQFGREQFLLYNSMTGQANRTLLGHNLVDDLCFARFDPETGVEPLVEVQQDNEQ